MVTAVKNNRKTKNFFLPEHKDQIETLFNPKTPSYLHLKEQVTGRDMPWYSMLETVDVDTTEQDYGFFSHAVLLGPSKAIGHQLWNLFSTPVSPDYLPLTQQVVREILDANKLDYSCIYRMNFNLCLHKGENVTSPLHTDLHFPHKILLIYMSNFSGGETVVEIDGVKHLSKPEEDKIIHVDGKYQHGVNYPSGIHDRRIVLNVCYI